MAADNSPNNIFLDDENCTDKYEEEPQLILANMTAGVLALNSLWRHIINDETRDSEVYNEVYFNVNTCAACPFERQPFPDRRNPRCPVAHNTHIQMATVKIQSDTGLDSTSFEIDGSTPLSA